MDWHFVIPISWAIVSAFLALLLYRTSSALFHQSIADKQEVRSVRLVGSIVIAGVIFGALKWATPEDLLRNTSADFKVISVSSVNAAYSASETAKNSLDKELACVAISPPQECRAEIENLRQSIENLGADIKRMK
jgi:hypothetical protein